MAKDRINQGLKNRFRKYGTKHVDCSVTLFQLYIKEKGVCRCCGIKTTYGIHPSQSDSATIEHIIPLSKGGNHTWSNVELLCEECNMKRNHVSQTDQKTKQEEKEMEKEKNIKIKISTKTIIGILFAVTLAVAIFLGFTEDHYTIKKLSFDIQSAIFLVAYIFYPNDKE